MFLETEYCPTCGGEIFAVYEHVLCFDCGWQGNLNKLLNEKDAKKLRRKKKLEKLNGSNN